MRANRALTLMVVSGALLAWYAGAATSKRDVQPPIVLPQPHVDLQGADLQREIARLHDRLRPDAAPHQPGRNLFAFHAGTKRGVMPVAAAVAPAVTETSAPTAPPAPVLKLDGIAEDDGPDGPVRTAIIAAEGQLFLVKPGDMIGSRYRVVRIATDVVELTDTIDNSVRRLALK